MRGKNSIYGNIATYISLITINLFCLISKVSAQTCTGDNKTDCETNTQCRWTDAGCIGKTDNALAEYINKIYDILLPIGAVAAIGMIVYAGIKYSTSGGSPDKIAEAKDIFISTIVGFAVLLLAKMIISLINPN